MLAKLWPIYSNFAHLLISQPPALWSLTLGAIACLCLVAWSIATGWGDAGERWQVMLLSTSSFLVAGTSTLILTIVSAWAGAAYLISTWGAGERATAWWTAQANLFSPSLIAAGGTGLILGTVSWWLVRRYFQPKIAENLGICPTKEELTDARTIKDHLPDPIKYDPRRYFLAARKAKAMFFGLDEARNPVFLHRDDWVKTHVQICGPTGTGKGVMAGVCLSQSIGCGDGVYILDPKNDEWAASVMAEACEREGKPFHLVDLRRFHPPQFDMLKGITKEELNSLFIAGFALGTKGTDADFYRKNDRAAARALSALADRGHVSLAGLARSAAATLPEDLAEKCEGFRRSLEEIAELEAPQAPERSQGAEIDGPIKNGGCLYIIGDMDDEAVVVLQKMLLVRLVQLVSARPRDGKQRHVTVFADEIRYMMSKKLGDVLGSVRDKGCNLILAHQSLDDLKTGDVPSPAVVIDNTGLRWLYRSTTDEMAQWIAGQTGTILVGKETRTTATNSVGSELGHTQRTVITVERHKIDQNMVQHLPNGVAVLIGAGPARLAFASPVPVTKKLDPAAFVIPAEQTQENPEPWPDDEDKNQREFLPCDLEDLED